MFVVRNKARWLLRDHRQEEGKDYDEVFTLVARIEDIRIFLAFASYMGFIVYQMDVKSAFLYGNKCDEEVYCLQPPGFVILISKEWSTKSGKTLYGFTTKLPEPTASTNELRPSILFVKDEEASDVDVHLYRSMIGSLMYLTASMPDIMFTVCACSRFQVTPKTSHLNAVKRIFRDKSTTLVYIDAIDVCAEPMTYLRGINKRNIIPLFDSMLVQPIEDEGEVSERPSNSQLIPSPTPPSEDQPEPQPDSSPRPSPSIPIPDSNPEGSGGNHGGPQLSSSAEIKTLKAQIKQLKKKARPVINHHKAWFRADRLKKQHNLKDMEKSKKRRSVSKQGRKAVKSSKGAPSVHTHTDWDAMDTDLEDYTLTQDEDPILTSTPTPSVFGDDETIAQVLVTMSQNKLKQKEKEKGAELKDVEDIKRPRPASTRSLLTLKPLPKIDPKSKGKGKIEEEDESDTKSEDITEAEKKFKMLANDEEMARKQDSNADTILLRKLQEEQREIFIHKREPSCFMIPLLHKGDFLLNKDMRGKKHSDLKTKIFEEIQVLYEKVKRSDENFIAIGSVEDEMLIKDLNKKASSIKKDDSIKEESKEEEGTKKRKLGTRKKMKSRKRRFRQNTSEDDSEKENDELRLCLTIAPDEDKEVDYEILDKKYPIIEWKSEYLGNKPQFDKSKDLEEINLNVVIRSNGQKRYFSTLMRVLSIFDRDDLNAVYQLVMDRYQDKIPEGFDRVLWEDLMIMFNPSDEDELLEHTSMNWNRISWKLHWSSGELEPEDSDGDEEDL
ncbi:putative ribonuclease H-like domain-containing protein [Tanacetum coccineum]